jgi:hypothetical protein
MARRACRGPAAAGEGSGRRHRLVPPLPAEQEGRQHLLVELDAVDGRAQRGGVPHRGLREPHAALVLVRRRQQVEVVHVMPVQLRRDVLRRVVRALQVVGATEGGDRVVDAAHAAQVVAPHVVGMRNGRGQPRERLPVCERLGNAADRLVGVHEVVVGGAVVGRQGQRPLVERHGRGGAPLAAPGRGGLLRVPAQQPQLRVADVHGQRGIDRLLVLGVLGRVPHVVHRLQLLRPQRDATLLAPARPRSQRFGPPQGLARRDGVLQAGVDAREADPGHREVRIDAQRLPERPRRLDPDVAVQLVQSLVVEGLRLRRRRADGLVRVPCAGPPPDRPLQDLPRDPGAAGAGRMRVVLGGDRSTRHGEQAHSEACEPVHRGSPSSSSRPMEPGQ